MMYKGMWYKWKVRKTENLKVPQRNSPRSNRSNRSEKEVKEYSDILEDSSVTPHSATSDECRLRNSAGNNNNNIDERGLGSDCDECPEDTNEADVDLNYLIDRWTERVLRKGVTGLRKEFFQLKSESVPEAESYREFSKNSNTGRNRYGNVYCLDETRVKLRAKPNASDYIHANYVNTPLMDRRFIATQGPTATTAADFWLMIWQHRVDIIVMLSAFEERGREKCIRYFPETEGCSLRFGRFTVLCNTSECLHDSHNSVLCREITLSLDGVREPLLITHYQWPDWPDHGVPQTDSSILRVLETARQSTRPIAVHCSAGIGRTGVVVTTEYVLEALSCHNDCSDMTQILRHLRTQRAGLVQTVQQYLFVHRLLLLYFIDSKRLKPTKEIDNFINDYETFVHLK